MESLRYTLIADGSSDKALMNIIKWVMNDLFPMILTSPQFADFRYLPKPPQKSNIRKQINAARRYYPYDILFYHRDAENNNIDIIEARINEIVKHLEQAEIHETILFNP